MAAASDPLRELLYKYSVGKSYIKSVWTPLTLDPCGAQVTAAALQQLLALDYAVVDGFLAGLLTHRTPWLPAEDPLDSLQIWKVP